MLKWDRMIYKKVSHGTTVIFYNDTGEWGEDFFPHHKIWRIVTTHLRNPPKLN